MDVCGSHLPYLPLLLKRHLGPPLPRRPRLGTSLVGLTTWIASRSPITASWLSASMNLLGSMQSVCSSRPSKIVFTRLSEPSCTLASRLRATIKFSHGHGLDVSPEHLRLAGAHAVLYNQDYVRCTLRLAPSTTSYTAVSPSFCCHHAPSKPTRCDLQVGNDGNEGTSPCPLTSAMIRREKPVISCDTCTVLLRWSPSCLAWQQLSFSFAVIQGLSLSLFISSDDQSSARPALIALRTIMPSSCMLLLSRNKAAFFWWRFMSAISFKKFFV